MVGYTLIVLIGEHSNTTSEQEKNRGVSFVLPTQGPILTSFLPLRGKSNPFKRI